MMKQSLKDAVGLDVKRNKRGQVIGTSTLSDVASGRFDVRPPVGLAHDDFELPSTSDPSRTRREVAEERGWKTLSWDPTVMYLASKWDEATLRELESLMSELVNAHARVRELTRAVDEFGR